MKDKGGCHRVRERRNELAHEAGKFVQWSELYDCLDFVDLELKNLGLVGERLKYAWLAKVTPFTDDSGKKLVTYSYGLKAIGDLTVMEVSWTEMDPPKIG